MTALDEFERGPWGKRFPTVVASWRRAWAHVIPFFAFPPEIRRVIYTTNALESLNARVRKIIKTRGHFPNDDAATKLIWLALRNRGCGGTDELDCTDWAPREMDGGADGRGDKYVTRDSGATVWSRSCVRESSQVSANASDRRQAPALPAAVDDSA